MGPHYSLICIGIISLVLLGLPSLGGRRFKQTPRELQEGQRKESRKTKSAEASICEPNVVGPSGLTMEQENLLAAATSAPAEFATDAFIRLATSKEVCSAALKRDLLETAFYLTAKAQQPVRLKVIPLPNSPVDTVAGYVSYAFDRRLDTLSLRSRIIKAMLAVDKPRTHQLLEEISPKLPLPPLSCEDVMVYDVSEFYELLSDVTQRSFSKKEIQQGAPTRFIQRYVAAISSSAQIAPAIKLILSIRTSPSELTLLVQVLIKAVGTIKADDRSFTQAVSRDGLTSEVYRLKQELENRDVYLGKDLLLAYREYLRANMSDSRCAENALSEKGRLPQYLQQANLLFSGTPLTFDEVKQKQVSTKASIQPYWNTSEAQRFLARFKDLKFAATPEKAEPKPLEVRANEDGEGDEDKYVTKGEKASVAWQLEFRQLLTDLDQWGGANEGSKLHSFHQKQVLYQGLFQLAPRTFMRNEVLKSWLNSLDDNEIQSSSRIEWYLHTYYLLEIANTSSPETRNTILESMINSNNVALSIYGRLARLQL